MKKYKWIMLICCFIVLLLSACKNFDSRYQQLQGVVKEIDHKNNKILVIAGLEEEDIKKDTQVVIESMDYTEVYWVSNIDPSDFTVGEKIIVYYDTAETSYPGKITSKKYEKLVEN
jgi:hypothetical protein